MTPFNLKKGNVYRFVEDTPNETIYKEGKYNDFQDYCDDEHWVNGSIILDDVLIEVLDMEATGYNDIDVLIYIVKEDVTTNLNWSYLSQFVTDWINPAEIWNNLNVKEI